MKNKIKILISISVLGLGVYLFLAPDSKDKQVFSSKLWKDDYANYEYRYNIVSLLEEKYLKKGMSKEEVIALLGEPDGRHPDGENLTWVKELGYDIGHEPERCDLTIYLDQNQKLVSWYRGCL